MENSGNYYLINHLVLFTGLTDRTIRNYISSGMLRGEKINGMWHFTPEDVDRFIRDPAVRPSILAKMNSLVYDFIINGKKTSGEMCTILDPPHKNRKAVAEYFCYRINSGSFAKLNFHFDGVGKTSRIVLTGGADDVLALLNDYKNEESLGRFDN